MFLVPAGFLQTFKIFIFIVKNKHKDKRQPQTTLKILSKITFQKLKSIYFSIRETHLYIVVTWKALFITREESVDVIFFTVSILTFKC